MLREILTVLGVGAAIVFLALFFLACWALFAAFFKGGS